MKMKITFFVACCLMSCLMAKAQWNPAGSTDPTVTLYRTGNVAIGGTPGILGAKLDVGNFMNSTQLGNDVVLRLRNIIQQNQQSGWGSAIEFFNTSNNYQPGGSIQGARIYSEALAYGWASNIKFKVFDNPAANVQKGIEAMVINANGNVTVGVRADGTPGDFEALSVYNVTNQDVASGTGTVLQFYNGVSNVANRWGASLKSLASNGQYGWESDLYLRTTKNNAFSSQSIINAMVIKGGTGNVGIGTINPDTKLAVKGTVHAEEVIVDTSVPVPDYVFENNYVLPTLDQVKSFIDQNKHLPEIPSAKEIEANGLNLGEMNLLLLKKIEELTLYQIESNKKIEMLQKQVETLQGKASK